MPRAIIIISFSEIALPHNEIFQILQFNECYWIIDNISLCFFFLNKIVGMAENYLKFIELFY